MTAPKISGTITCPRRNAAHISKDTEFLKMTPNNRRKPWRAEAIGRETALKPKAASRHFVDKRSARDTRCSKLDQPIGAAKRLRIESGDRSTVNPLIRNFLARSKDFAFFILYAFTDLGHVHPHEWMSCTLIHLPLPPPLPTIEGAMSTHPSAQRPGGHAGLPLWKRPLPRRLYTMILRCVVESMGNFVLGAYHIYGRESNYLTRRKKGWDLLS